MRKFQRIFLLVGMIALLLGAVLVTTKKEQPQPQAISETGSAWTWVKADPISRDVRVLDAIIRDALTNKELRSTRESYGEAGNRTVRYARFPVGYTPTVPGYDFLPVPPEPTVGLKLTMVLGGLWLDQTPPNEKFAFFLADEVDRGALLYICNSGSGTIGGCSVGYEVKAVADGWAVRCIGYRDP